MDNLVLILDLSTTSTGYALFNKDSKKLITYGVLKPKVPGIHKMDYPSAVYWRIKDISEKVKQLVEEYKPTTIVIEEVNRGINRIAQKGLDACHFFVLDYLCLLDKAWLDKVIYIDSNGKNGWRGILGLKLSEEDKKKNKEIRKQNKKSKLKYAPIDWKTLSCRWVKEHYNIDLDPQKENDIADSICLGSAYLRKA